MDKEAERAIIDTYAIMADLLGKASTSASRFLEGVRRGFLKVSSTI